MFPIRKHVVKLFTTVFYQFELFIICKVLLNILFHLPVQEMYLSSLLFK